MRSKSTPNPDSESQSSFDFSEVDPHSLSYHQRPVGFGVGTRLYATYRTMIQRCCNENSKAYKDYGGRGISICKEWRKSYNAFIEWSLANGYADDLTIDRKDNDSGYSPANCRWATSIEQSNNKRNNVFVIAWGETKTIALWSRDIRCKIGAAALYLRLRNGMEPEAAISTPVITLKGIPKTKPMPKGEAHVRAKLTETAVVEIRTRYNDGSPVSELARKYNVTNGCIWFIVRRIHWKHIT